ncbi:MAG: aminopeptidase [Myxococcales bacterium]|nr:aminopeptidase [Myxococcales bacterium]
MIELRVAPASALTDSAHDAVLLVVPAPLADHLDALAAARPAVEAALAADAALSRGARAPVVVLAPQLPGGRLILTTYGSGLPANAEIEDVRLVAEAASAAMARAVEAGASRPVLLVVAPRGKHHGNRFEQAIAVGALGALASQWVPLEAREAGKAPRGAERLTVVDLPEAVAARVRAIEAGRLVARDLTGTEPERMAPPRVAELCEQAFEGTSVSVRVERDVSGYPLLAAVARASNVVERHRPCVIELEWKPKGPVQGTVVLVGKGVTYDTGGADLKTDGAMAGMSRDKGGAGAVAGVLRAVAALDLPVRVVGLLGMVRNSIGEESFVTDEIIRSRGGVRVRIGNTDAEGRLVLSDLLARGREILEGIEGASLFSVATLTGHVYRAHGPYTGALCNAPARDLVARLDKIAEAWGEPMEHARPRREDYTIIAGRSSAEDVVSCNRLPSVSTPRGHQFPFAFLDVSAGLRGGTLPFVHLDIGGAAVDPPDWQFGKPTAIPVSTLTSWLAGGV